MEERWVGGPGEDDYWMVATQRGGIQWNAVIRELMKPAWAHLGLRCSSRSEVTQSLWMSELHNQITREETAQNFPLERMSHSPGDTLKSTLGLNWNIKTTLKSNQMYDQKKTIHSHFMQNQSKWIHPQGIINASRRLVSSVIVEVFWWHFKCWQRFTSFWFKLKPLIWNKDFFSLILRVIFCSLA